MSEQWTALGDERARRVGFLKARGALANIFQHYLGLPCYLISTERWWDWTGVTTVYGKTTPLEHETDPVSNKARLEYNQRVHRWVIRHRKSACVPHRGLYGLFVPVLEEGRCVSILQTGVFLRGVPTETDLTRQWQRLTGHLPGRSEEAFLDYARAVLGAPVLADDVLTALQGVLKDFGELLTDRVGWEEARDRFDAACRKVFAPKMGNTRWVEAVLLQKRFFRRPSFERRIMDWERREMGLTRFPTAVMAVKLEGTGNELTDLLASCRLQQRAARLAWEIGETVHYPLEQYGALFLTSPPEGSTPARRKLDLASKAERLAAGLSRAAASRVFVGIGQGEARGGDLLASYHEAVAALHVAESQGISTVFFENASARPGARFSARRKVASFVRSLEEDGTARLALLRRGFVEDVLRGNVRRPEAVRRVFLEALHRLVEALERRGWMEQHVLEGLEDEYEDDLASAYGLHDLVARFGRCLDRLAPFLDRPREAGKTLRLRKAKEEIDGSLDRDWRLPEAARRFGFSQSAFSREFTRAMGKPFSGYLLEQRLEKAKRLLSGGGLSLAAVSQACGFSSQNYFQQVFKRRVGRSPARYRRHCLKSN